MGSKKQFEKILCDFDIGDLVMLNGDTMLQVGYGLITDIKFDFDDIYDFKYLADKIRLKRHLNGTLDTIEDDMCSTKPQVLVLWNSLGKSNNMNKHLWMHSGDLILVQKVQKDSR